MSETALAVEAEEFVDVAPDLNPGLPADGLVFGGQAGAGMRGSFMLMAAAPTPAEPSAPVTEPSSPFEFIVTAANKDARHPFFNVGHDRGFLVNGVQGKALVLIRGETYTFNVDTGVQHDFYLSRSEAGWGAAAWTQGVSGQFIYKGEVTFTPGSETPDLLYYQCRNHRNMGAAIHVVDSEAEAVDKRAELAAAREALPEVVEVDRRPVAASEAEVSQKIAFADQYLNESAAADRVRDSGIESAINLFRAALQTYVDARAAHERGDLDIALLLVDTSMRMMSEASLFVPRDIEGEAQRAQFENHYEGARTFLDSYNRNVERMGQRDRDKIEHVDVRGIEASMARAREHADRGRYADGIALLSDAQQTLTRALTGMLADESISYELDFATPKEEYEYELSRYESYERLVPIAIEQRRPSQQQQDLMMRSVERAQEIRGLVDAEVRRGDFQEAILMLQGATSHIQRALQIVGVR